MPSGHRQDRRRVITSLRSLATSGKPFDELTEEEAATLAREILRSSHSEDDARRRLTDAGFRGDSAVRGIVSKNSGPIFEALMMTWGPKGEVIRV